MCPRRLQQQQQQQPKQFTHFAPQQLPAELAVAAVLATPPSLNGRSDGKSSSSGTGGTDGKGGGSTGAGAASGGSLSRSAHFFSLAFSLFEELLGARFPLPAMQQASGFLMPAHCCGQQQLLAPSCACDFGLPSCRCVTPKHSAPPIHAWHAQQRCRPFRPC